MILKLCNSVVYEYLKNHEKSSVQELADEFRRIVPIQNEVNIPTFQNFPSVQQPTYPSQSKNQQISNWDKFPRLEHTSHTMSLSELPPKLRNPKPRLSRREKGKVYKLGQ